MKHDLSEHFTPLNVFERVIRPNILVDLLLSEKNLYAQESDWNIFTNSDEMKVFIGINYFMIINSLPCALMYWDYNSFVGNSGIMHAFTRTRFQVAKQCHCRFENLAVWLNPFKNQSLKISHS